LPKSSTYRSIEMMIQTTSDPTLSVRHRAKI
jgi:hypothetical protein